MYVVIQSLRHEQDSIQGNFLWSKFSFDSKFSFSMSGRLFKIKQKPSAQLFSPISWGCRIHQLHFWREVRPPPPNKCSGYDIYQSDSEVPAWETWGMWCTPLLPLLPGPLWPGVIAPDKVLSMNQIEQTKCSNKWLVLNCESYIVILESISLWQSAGAAEYIDCISAEG